MAKSVQHDISQTRKPRVHITYDVETNGAVEKRELPFVVGVMGDFSGNPLPDPGRKMIPLKERKFIQIDRDNFNDVLSRMAPELNFRVKNTLDESGQTELGVRLKFNSMDDFSPAKVAEQVPALKELLDVRNKLRDLQANADMSDKLEGALDEMLKNTDALKGK
jgi:type VI secretion system protein ImpB